MVCIHHTVALHDNIACKLKWSHCGQAVQLVVRFTELCAWFNIAAFV